MSQLRILLYGDINLNFMDGSAVWLTSIAPVLSSNPRIQVDLLLKAKEQNSRLTSALEGYDNLKIIQPFESFAKLAGTRNTRLTVAEAVQIMARLHQENPYDLVIVRGFNLVREIMHYEVFRPITVPYLTDFKHDHRSTKEERTDLKRVYDHFDHLFLQTKETKEAFKKLVQVDGEKIQLLYPMIPDLENELPRFQNRHSRLIYSGKFHEDWYTEEIIEATKKLAKENPQIHTQIVGDKFQERLREPENQLRIKNEFQKTSAIDWVGAVSRDRCQALIAEADVGISWRSASLDNDDSVELSSKLLEYGRLGKPALVRRTKMHEDILGKEYPLFVDSEADFVSKTLAVLSDDRLYFEAAQMIYQASKAFTFSAAYERLKDFIWSFKKTKTHLLFAGHDLKFAVMLMEYFEQHPDFEVKKDQFTSHEKHDEKYSQECLKWADVIFCEWGLGNAVWYSKHKREDQVLITRMHFQEKDLNYPRQIVQEKIDEFIVITPYMLEEFHRIFKIPRHKMRYLDNLIDSTKLDLPKTEDYQFHLGICGILPARKRLDLAVDLLEKLWKKDSRYKLFIKSKLPEELPWLMAREKERKYYTDLFERINQAPWKDSIVFDPHGDDVDRWLQKIGYLLSPSDFEGSHVSVSEAMASGAVPIINNWKGADTVYPKRYIVSNLEDATELVSDSQWSKQAILSRKKYACEKFSRDKIVIQVEQLIKEMLTKAR